VERWPVVHGGLRVVAAMELIRAQTCVHFWAQKLTVVASNQSGSGGGPHRGLLRLVRRRRKAGGSEQKRWQLPFTDKWLGAQESEKDEVK
jgi:hypothetical protein